MVFVLIKSPNALTINQETFQFLALMVSIQELRPAPETLCARIDGWSNTESLFLASIYDDSVQKEGFACSVLACNSNDSHSLLDA